MNPAKFPTAAYIDALAQAERDSHAWTSTKNAAHMFANMSFVRRVLLADAYMVLSDARNEGVSK